MQRSRIIVVGVGWRRQGRSSRNRRDVQGLPTRSTSGCAGPLPTRSKYPPPPLHQMAPRCGVFRRRPRMECTAFRGGSVLILTSAPRLRASIDAMAQWQQMAASWRVMCTPHCGIPRQAVQSSSRPLSEGSAVRCTSPSGHGPDLWGILPSRPRDRNTPQCGEFRQEEPSRQGRSLRTPRARAGVDRVEAVGVVAVFRASRI